jgi:hypothetical protein
LIIINFVAFAVIDQLIGEVVRDEQAKTTGTDGPDPGELSCAPSHRRGWFHRNSQASASASVSCFLENVLPQG